MTDKPAPARTPPPWATMIIGASGTLVVVLGLFVAIGGWLRQIDEHERRLSKVEQVQQTNLPTFYKMTENLAYLAERARREDERLAREQERGR